MTDFPHQVAFDPLQPKSATSSAASTSLRPAERNTSHDDLVSLLGPEAAIQAMISSHQMEMTARQEQLEKSQRLIGELLDIQQKMNRTGRNANVAVETIDDVDEVRDRLDDLSSSCTEEVWSFNPGGAQSPDNLARSRAANEETLRRGVRMRALYLESVRNDPLSAEHVSWLTTMGAEVRTNLTLPIRMVVVDRSAAVIPVGDQQSSRGALLISEPGIVSALVALFVSTWRASRTLGPRDRRPSPGMPNAQELQALRLWGQGCTDAAVARALGVSERTVRRMSETLASRLCAGSRFQAGARAVEMGWLKADDLM